MFELSLSVPGLLYRQEKGIAKIGWESTMIILLFAAGYVLMSFLE